MVRDPRYLLASPLRSTRLTSQLGVALGVAIGVCFVTGYLSHAIQHPPWWFSWPSRPVSLYRVTQGLHVATGLAAVPLLAAKLWSVYPRLFVWPPVRGVAHGLERLSIAVLVSATLFQLVTGVLNISLWYAPMPFFFTAAHYWTAWLVVGAVLLHLAVKLPVVRAGLARPGPETSHETSHETVHEGLTRRGLLATVGAAVAAVTVATAGQTVPGLRRVSVLAPRDPKLGPQGLPVNATAAAARVSRVDGSYRLTVVGPHRTVELTLADLAAMPQHTASLPITCVEGWSADATWSGVRISDLMATVGGDPDAEVLVESLQTGGRYRASVLDAAHARDPLTLLALRLHGEPLHLDHGYPCRLIAPNRPGVLQTKWVGRLTVGGAR